MQGKHSPENPSRRRVLKAAVLGAGAAAVPGLAYAGQAMGSSGSTSSTPQAVRPRQAP
jgi:hypothetical protein